MTSPFVFGDDAIELEAAADLARDRRRSRALAAELLERGELQRAERPTVRIERNAAGEAE